jgi:hypothetical protein
MNSLTRALPLFVLSCFGSSQRATAEMITRWEQGCNGDRCELFAVRDTRDRYVAAPQEEPDSSPVVTGEERVLERMSCTKTVVVPSDTYWAIVGILGAVGGNDAKRDGAPVLNPAEQNMLLFYNTVTEQTKGFSCGSR